MGRPSMANARAMTRWATVMARATARWARARAKVRAKRKWWGEEGEEGACGDTDRPNGV